MMRLIGTTRLVAIVAVACGGGDDEHGAAAVEAQDGGHRRRECRRTWAHWDGGHQDRVRERPRSWLMNPDGTGSERLTRWKEAGKILPDDGRPVSWSPDGTRIAFVGWDDEDGAHIYTLKGDGTDLVRLTQAARGDYAIRACPVWSPDGTRIAFSEEDCVYVIDVDGTGLRRLGRPTPTGGGLPCPVWSR